MEQKQLKMWLPSFLTWRAEHVLQKQAEMGYLLMAVENFGSFYTFSFESAPPLPRRFYVLRQDDIGKWGAHGRSPKEIAEEEISPYCAEIFECSDSYSFVAELRQDVPDDVISKTVERRMRNTAKYHVELFAIWLLLPVICLIVLTITNTPWEWGNRSAGAMLMGALLMYHATAAIISYTHR